MFKSKSPESHFDDTSHEPPSSLWLSQVSLPEAVHWLRLLWPSFLVVLSGLVFFRQAVVATITATPHPVLVLGIFVVCLVAIGLTMVAVRQYLLESLYAQRWLALPESQRASECDYPTQASVFMPVYQLLCKQHAFSAQSRQAAVMAELEAGAFALEQKLELPHFLGGALVGMGLVGTFIGLLGTLEDLSTVFSALVNPSISTMSPTQMFSDMVTKLQAPMQGMGTAFVASLYGLLGSLLVTLMMVSARKTIASTLHHIHAVVRQLDYGARRPVQHTAWAAAGLDDTIQPAPDGLDTLRWLKVLQTSVEDLTRQVTAHQAQQDLIARQMTHLVQELLTAGQTTAASQVKTEQVIRQMLHQADQDTDSDTSPPQNKP